IAFVSPDNFDDNVNIQVMQIDADRLSDSEVEETIGELDKIYPQNYTDFRKIASGAVTVDGARGLEYAFSSKRLDTVLYQKIVIFVKSGRAFTITFTAVNDHFEKMEKDNFRPVLENFKVQ
ncbi:MAG: hypothetical protein AB1499_06845, partial [Nitrospirota bacterium]